MNYPNVIGEYKTLTHILKYGKSIARYGDGELKLMEGKGYIREVANEQLSSELRRVIKHHNDACIIGIPTMDPDGPKYPNWSKHKDRFMQYFQQADGNRYYSAFISRPDSAPAIDTPEYIEMIRRLWRGRKAVVICEPANKLLSVIRLTDPDVAHLPCIRHGAYSTIESLEREAIALSPEVVIMACGPTATCLADRFARRGVQGIDLGSIGGFLMKRLST